MCWDLLQVFMLLFCISRFMVQFMKALNRMHKDHIAGQQGESGGKCIKLQNLRFASTTNLIDRDILFSN